MGDEKKSRISLGLIFILVGIVVLIAGIVFFNVTDMTKYYDTEDYNESFDATNITNIDITCGFGTYTIKSTTDNKITVEAENIDADLIHFKTDGNTFIADEDTDTWYKHFQFMNFGGYDKKIVITLPQKLYDKVKIQCGAGNIDISGIECNNGDFQLGVGEVKVDSIKANNVSIDCGVGNADFDNVIFGESDIDCGVGNVTISGQINGDCDIDCGVGNVDINIDGNRGDYSISTDGDVDISGNNTSGTKQYEMDIDAGVGNCDINFR